jgi:hypothetical protein
MSERRCAWGEIGIRSDAVDAFELITISISSAPHNQPHATRFLLSRASSTGWLEGTQNHSPERAVGEH